MQHSCDSDRITYCDDSRYYILALRKCSSRSKTSLMNADAFSFLSSSVTPNTTSLRRTTTPVNNTTATIQNHTKHNQLTKNYNSHQQHNHNRSKSHQTLPAYEELQHPSTTQPQQFKIIPRHHHPNLHLLLITFK